MQRIPRLRINGNIIAVPLLILFFFLCLNVIGNNTVYNTVYQQDNFVDKDPLCAAVGDSINDESFDINKDGKYIVVNKDYGTIAHRPYLNCFDQESARLKEILNDKYIEKPSKLPYSFKTPPPLDGQTKDFMELVYKNKVPRDGFFIEAGAHDGYNLTVTLELEMKYGWKGLLVEAMPNPFQEMLKLNRKAYQVNTCLGLKKRPHFSKFDVNHALRAAYPGDDSRMVFIAPGLVEKEVAGGSAVNFQCLPLFALLNAIGNPTVNLFVLDIEGAEFQVLRTIPWEKVDIEVLSVETEFFSRVFSNDKKEDLIDFMKDKGYRKFEHRYDFVPEEGVHRNALFIRNDVVYRNNIEGYL